MKRVSSRNIAKYADKVTHGMTKLLVLQLDHIKLVYTQITDWRICASSAQTVTHKQIRSVLENLNNTTTVKTVEKRLLLSLLGVPNVH